MGIKLTIRYAKSISSHNVMLIRAVLASKGDVAEVGSGVYSTPLLHWLCRAMGRKLVTYENNDTFYEFARTFRSGLHSVKKIENWDTMDFKRHWGVVFIDHAPGQRRHKDIMNFKDSADYIVIHDTEPRGEKVYHYSRVWKYFKYKYDFTDFTTHTTVVSNLYSLDDFDKFL